MAECGFRVLFVDDEEQALMSYESLWLAEGGVALLCQDPTGLEVRLAEDVPDVLVFDLSFPGVDGLELLPNLLGRVPDLPTIVVTAQEDVDTAVRCMKAGAYDYLVKPVDRARLLATLRRAGALRQLARERDSLLRGVSGEGPLRPEPFAGILTGSGAMRSLFAYIEGIAPSREPVLITGETGVGKELFARAVHEASGRAGAFVAVNTAGIDDHVFCDTLFGHAKGAFTGAAGSRAGLVESAAEGTLFLDEIGDLDGTSQAKLLRLLQEGDYFRLGEDRPRHSSARVLAATNRDLEAMQKQGAFRPDLYFRLRTHRVLIPPLRERLADLPLLVDHFLAAAAAELGKPVPTVPPQLVRLLSTYDFPGNVRELKALLHDAVAQHQGHVMSLETVRAYVLAEALPEASGENDPDALFPGALPPLKDVQRLLVEEALRRTAGNKSMAAQLLGTTRQALNHHLRKG